MLDADTTPVKHDIAGCKTIPARNEAPQPGPSNDNQL